MGKPKKKTKPVEKKVTTVDEQSDVVTVEEMAVQEEIETPVVEEPTPEKKKAVSKPASVVVDKKDAPEVTNRYIPMIEANLKRFQEIYHIIVKSDKDLHNSQRALYNVFDLMLRDKTRESFDLVHNFFKTNVAEDFLHEAKALVGNNLMSDPEREIVSSLYVCFRSITSMTKADISLDVLRKVVKNDDIIKYFSEFID